MGRYKCDVCEESYVHASFLVQCDQEGNVPYGSSHMAQGMKRLADLIEEDEQQKDPFHNMIDKDSGKESLQSMCYKCHGLVAHNDENHYVKRVDADKVVLHSQFGNLRKKWHGRDERTENRILAAMAWNEWSKMPSHLTWEDVYKAVVGNSDVAAAGDFHVMLGAGVQLRYTCPQCFYGPLHPKYWLRCVNDGRRHQPGGTKEGGDWRCPWEGCLQKWSWGRAGKLRAILVPETDESNNLEMMVIGPTTSVQEHTISLLKAGKLLEAVELEDGSLQDLGKPALVSAIRKLNEEAAEQVVQSQLERHSKKTASMQELRDKGINPYCEDRELSLAQPGVRTNALYLPPETPVISPGLLDELLDLLVCFYDLSDVTAKGHEIKQALKKAIAVQEARRKEFFSRPSRL